jgi:membrane protease YdiL (CAAX protease family)
MPAKLVSQPVRLPTETAIEPVSQPPGVPWLLMLIFAVISFGLAWLICLPLWLGKGLAEPLFQVYASAMMFTPAIATLVVVIIQRRQGVYVDLGIRPQRPVRRLLGYAVLALVGLPLLALTALLLSWAFGTVDLDPVHLSGFRALLDAQLKAAGKGPEALGGAPIHLIAALQVANIVVNAVVASFLTFGEEVGWRGWLLPNLRPLGAWPALLLTGLAWGAWHAPIILLGYNYQRRDLLGVLLMIVFCVLLGIVLGWLRLRSRSLWPAVIGHAAVNASVGAWTLILIRAGTRAHSTTSMLLGWPGWLLMTVVIAAVATVQRIRCRRQARVR